jgi:hypothetical protein
MITKIDGKERWTRRGRQDLGLSLMVMSLIPTATLDLTQIPVSFSGIVVLSAIPWRF